MQPALSLLYERVSLGVWRSTAEQAYIQKEFDVTLAYETGDFNIADGLLVAGETVPYEHYTASYCIEGFIGYSFRGGFSPQFFPEYDVRIGQG
jgi:hypothetical protein